MITDILLGLDVNGYTEKKGKLTYLSWANAWREVLKVDSKATYHVIKNPNGTPEFGNAKLGYMVYTDVTIDGVTREMWLYVMDGANKPLKDEDYNYMTKYNGEKTVEAITMSDINKTVMRCLTKNLAMFGLGLYIYAGEDLPEEEPKELTLDDLKELCTTVGYEVDKFIESFNEHSEEKIKTVNELPKDKIKLYHTWLQGKVKK